MPIRLKKLIGTILLIVLVIVSALVATTVAAARLGESGPLVLNEMTRDLQVVTG